MVSPADELMKKLKVIKYGLTTEERKLTLQNYAEFLMP